MKQRVWILTLACLLLVQVSLPMTALADDSGVLGEKELNTWIQQLLRSTGASQPLNAPVNEDALTQEGYAFLYDQATLYYDKPTLDQTSKLQAISVTDEALETPRGIRLGSPATLLVETYGWQNLSLIGDGSFAVFYALDQLPQSAYWSWAQHEGPGVTSVQCAIHVRETEDSYTDAGVLYQLQDGVVSGIQVYGLQKRVTLSEVYNNLGAMAEVQAAGSGDTPGK